MYSVSKTSPNSDLTLLIMALPRILSSDSFYEKFARRLNNQQSNDLTVEAARLALEANEKGVRRRYNKISRMTACVALTGSLKRGLSPISRIERTVLIRACERLVKDVPMMSRSIGSWKQQKQLISITNGFSDPILN